MVYDKKYEHITKLQQNIDRMSSQLKQLQIQKLTVEQRELNEELAVAEKEEGERLVEVWEHKMQKLEESFEE